MDVLHNQTQRTLFRRTLIDYLLYFPALAVSGLMGLVSVAVLSKFFSPEQYGHYTLALSTLLLISMVTGLWLRSSVLRLQPQYAASHQTNEFVGTVVIAGTLVTAFIVALYALGLPFLRSTLDPELYQLLWLVVPGAPLLTGFTVIQESHRIQGRSALYSGLVLVRVLGGFLIGLLLLAKFEWGPVGMLAGLFIALSAAIGGHLFRAGRWIARKVKSLSWSAPVLKDMMAFSLPIVGLNLASMVLAVSDRYLIETYLSSYDLGLYAATYSLAEGGMRLLANTFLIATQPTIFNAWVNNGPQAAFQFVERLFRYYLIISLPALVGLSLLSNRIMTLFTTPEYASASTIVVYVSIAIFLHGYSLIVGTVFDAAKQTRIPLKLFLVAGLVNVVLNLLLLPRFGYYAAAWSTVAGYALLLWLHITAARSIVRLHIIDPYLWKVGLASAGMGLFVLTLQTYLSTAPLNLLLIVGIGAVAYAVLLVAIGVPSDEEKQMIKAGIKRIYEWLRQPSTMINRSA